MPDVDLQVADARSAVLAPASVDLVLLFTVFSSIERDEVIDGVVARIREVLRPDGAVVWYDFLMKNPRNPHTRPMRRADIMRFFPDFEPRLRRVTLLPPLARRLGRLVPRLYPILAACPFLCFHYAGLLVRRPR